MCSFLHVARAPIHVLYVAALIELACMFFTLFYVHVRALLLLLHAGWLAALLEV
jgi:hypothetical protein